MKKKIAFVNQRYGLDVNGGSELHCRQLAEKMCALYEVEVLTTCAIDYVSWDNHYSEGLETINGVMVRRFKTDKSRNVKKFDKISQKVLSNPEKNSLRDELEWIEEQGPYAPDFLEYMKEHASDYDAIIYCDLHHYLAVHGILSSAHDYMYLMPLTREKNGDLKIYKSVFHHIRGFLFQSKEEQQKIEEMFYCGQKPSITIETNDGNMSDTVVIEISELIEKGWDSVSLGLEARLDFLQKESEELSDKITYPDILLDAGHEKKKKSWFTEEDQSFQLEALIMHMEVVNRSWLIALNREIPKRPGLFGTVTWYLKRVIRKLIHFYVDPLIEEQVTFNFNVINSLNQMRNFIVEQENKEIK